MAAPDPTKFTKIGGIAQGAHGADPTFAGLRSLYSGRARETMAAKAARPAAFAAHASPVTAGVAGDMADALAPAGVLHRVSSEFGVPAFSRSGYRAPDVRYGSSRLREDVFTEPGASRI